MKKTWAIRFLVIGTLAAVAAMSLFNSFFAFGQGYRFGEFFGIAVIVGAAFGAYCLSKLFRRKYGLSAPKFFLYAYVPPIVVSGIYLAVVIGITALGLDYFIFWGGFGILIAVCSAITSVVFAAVGGIWLAVGNRYSKNGKDNSV